MRELLRFGVLWLGSAGVAVLYVGACASQPAATRTPAVSTAQTARPPVAGGVVSGVVGGVNYATIVAAVEEGVAGGVVSGVVRGVVGGVVGGVGCSLSSPGVFQEVTNTRASPYFVHHPSAAALAPGHGDVPTVIFLPGGAGTRVIARDYIWKNWLERGRRLDAVRVVIPYTNGKNFADEVDRVLVLRDELLTCYGGARTKVHLGGTSNGGRQAFALMLRAGDQFASLLGAPGVFPGELSDGALKQALGDKRVYSGVGARDETWKKPVRELHERMVKLGIRSTYVEFPDQDHILDEHFDPSGFFEFWLAAP